jgi:triosephosphate isomerase (TIM)
MQTRKKFVAGNWKMFTTRATAEELARGVAAGVKDHADRVDVLVCPPFPYLDVVGKAITGSPVALGAQDCFSEREGAFTGEVSPTMLADLGCTHVILGHSERRHKLGETNEVVNRKVRLAMEVGLRVILCVGETLAEREADQTEKALNAQLSVSLAGIPRERVSQLVVAYEPVWAIGTGRNATPEQAQQAHTFLRRRAVAALGDDVARAVVILYGGSVNPGNAAVLFAQPDVDGGLIGGASLKAKDFLDIVKAALPV